LALAAVVCALAAWLAGPAHANGPVAGVPAPVTAVQQAAAPVVTTTPVRSTASPGWPAARVHRARAAAAETATVAETSSSRTATTAEPTANDAAAAIETGANHGATAVERTAAASAAQTVDAVPRQADDAVRAASARTASGVRTAPRRAAAVGAAPKQLVASAKSAAANTASKLGWTVSTAELAAPRRADRTRGEAVAPSGDLATSTGAALPATATGSAPRPAAGAPSRSAAGAAREVRTQRLDRVGGELSGLALPTTQPAAPTSAATGLAGAAASALLGLLGLLILASQRLGTVVRLRPASAPASPFLTLPERPG
jgi:hypothetical protein